MSEAMQVRNNMTSAPDELFPVLIERRLKLQRALGEALVDVVFEIGHPYWTEPDVEAACPVAIRGTVGRVNDIRGIDLLSAMKQAINFVEAYLDHPTEGEKFFWPNGEEF
jgi:hypothetical protein